jgi:hypothetical protein
MALLRVQGHLLQHLCFRFGSHLECAASLGINIQTSQLLILFSCHDLSLLYDVGE